MAYNSPIENNTSAGNFLVVQCLVVLQGPGSMPGSGNLRPPQAAQCGQKKQTQDPQKPDTDHQPPLKAVQQREEKVHSGVLVLQNSSLLLN